MASEKQIIPCAGDIIEYNVEIVDPFSVTGRVKQVKNDMVELEKPFQIPADTTDAMIIHVNQITRIIKHQKELK